MFCKIKAFLSSMGLKCSDISISVKGTPLGIEDVKAVEQRKRIGKAFEQQYSELQARALVAHESDCDDPLFCRKQPCFKWEPDRIVADSLSTVTGRPPKIKVKVEQKEVDYLALALEKKEIKHIVKTKAKKFIFMDMSYENKVDSETKKE